MLKKEVEVDEVETTRYVKPAQTGNGIDWGRWGRMGIAGGLMAVGWWTLNRVWPDALVGQASNEPFNISAEGLKPFLIAAGVLVGGVFVMYYGNKVLMAFRGEDPYEPQPKVREVGWLEKIKNRHEQDLLAAWEDKKKKKKRKASRKSKPARASHGRTPLHRRPYGGTDLLGGNHHGRTQGELKIILGNYEDELDSLRRQRPPWVKPTIEEKRLVKQVAEMKSRLNGGTGKKTRHR